MVFFSIVGHPEVVLALTETICCFSDDRFIHHHRLPIRIILYLRQGCTLSFSEREASLKFVLNRGESYTICKGITAFATA